MANEIDDLYEAVWGEPAGQPEGAVYDRVQLNPPLPGRAKSPVVSPTGTEILRRIEQLEARIFEIQQVAIDGRKVLEIGSTELTEAIERLQQDASSSMEADITQPTVMRDVHAVEVQMIRMERGMVRSLEHVEARIKEIGR